VELKHCCAILAKTIRNVAQDHLVVEKVFIDDWSNMLLWGKDKYTELNDVKGL
jgi:ribosomal protein L31E